MLLVWMSRSAIPAALSAARTWFIRLAACCSAPVALGERVTTPAEMIARSGTRVTSPVALISRRVPAIVCVTLGVCCAAAAAGSDAAAIVSAASKACLIVLISLVAHASRKLAPAPWLFAERGSPGSAAPGDQPIDQQNQECADNCGDEARALAHAVPTDRVADPAGEQRPGNAEQHRDDAAARIAARHQQLRDPAGEPSDHDPGEDSVMFHHPASPLQPSGAPVIPVAEMRQRALAAQVPPLVEKDWRSQSDRSVLRKVSYCRNTVAITHRWIRKAGRE